MFKAFPVLRVSDQLLRSPQPDFEDLIRLKAEGLRGVVNLRDEATESAFFAKQAGLSYLHLPVVDWDLPSLEQVEQFFQFLESSDNAPALVHCAMGVGRTGTFVGCYRVRAGMGAQEAVELTNLESPLPGVTMNSEQMLFVTNFE